MLAVVTEPTNSTRLMYLCLVIMKNVLYECGEVELNPGPSVEEMLDEVLKGQKQISGDAALIKLNQQKSDEQITSIFQRL